ncbi:hypothetical protein L3Y34_005434 [Caenorhabditis briggsae]|uniref:Uncharacterized protein n=1 Tax=Caenorhabditis briggsae TaxID=6238 RepID=A0AAE9D6A4_CAEBR|nr:hypothetical protein L3Y34_005434 [Caenorhabditis briggsae]
MIRLRPLQIFSKEFVLQAPREFRDLFACVKLEFLDISQE